MIKERPILFSGPMVRAILEGRKTQTRRVVKPQPVRIADPDVPFKTPDADPKGIIDCPYGQPGDRLWVRESFEVVREVCSWESAEYDYFDWDEEIYGPAKDALKAKCPRGGERAMVLYMADGEDPVSRWTPSIHMPRWASRLTLEVLSVRVERLQDISEGDAWAEGIGRIGRPLESLANVCASFPKLNVGRFALESGLPFTFGGSRPASDREKVVATTSKAVYGALWEAINGPGSWNANPWVWVVEFKKLNA